jgi:hypothetical protein
MVNVIDGLDRGWLGRMRSAPAEKAKGLRMATRRHTEGTPSDIRSLCVAGAARAAHVLADVSMVAFLVPWN